MNNDDLQKTWNTPGNNLASEQQRALAEKFTLQMIRHRRFQLFWIIQSFTWLTLITGLAIWAIAIGKVNPTREWVLFPLLIAPWGFATYFLRRYLKPNALPQGESPIADSLRAALTSNQSHQSHLKLVGLLFIITVPLLVLAMQQLQGVGKISSRELLSMAWFFGATLLGSGAVIATRYFGSLLPNQKRIEDLLSQFD